MITGAILAGGLGSRLRPVVSNHPKALAPVGDRPFLHFLLDQLEAAGFSAVVLCTGHLGHLVREALGGRYRSLQVRYSEESTPLGTAGALRLALPLLKSDPVLVLNGDSYCGVDLSAFIEWHYQRNGVGSLVLVHSDDASRFGRVTCGREGAIRQFGEKQEAAGSGWINAGVYLLSQRLLRTIPRGRQVSLEYEVFPSWAGRGLYGYAVNGKFIDIGTPASYAKADSFLARGAQEPAARNNSLFRNSATPNSRRYVLLDRDGTLNVERNYLSDPDEFELLPGSVEGLRLLQSLDIGLVVISNQSGIGRGYFDVDRLGAIHSRMAELLRREGIELDKVYFCPHSPEQVCECRKPRNGLGLAASEELGFELGQSFVIGDKDSDILFGKNLGAFTFLVRTGYGAEVEKQGRHGADYVVADLWEAARVISQLVGKQSEVASDAKQGRR